MDRRGRTGKIVYLVNLDEEGERHVVAQELKARVRVQVLHVALAPSEQVVGAQHLMAISQQPIDEMRAEKPCSPGHQNTFPNVIDP